MDLDKGQLEYIRHLSRQRFDKVRGTWIDLGEWAAPDRVKKLLSQTQGARNNRHIVDPTHLVALRSCTAGFMEGNTSETRPWFRPATGDMELDMFPAHHEWLDKFGRLSLRNLSRTNFYHTSGGVYRDYHVFNTVGIFVDIMPDGTPFFHLLDPGEYHTINNGFGEPIILCIETTMTVKALVDKYGRDAMGQKDWSNISEQVRKMYEDGNYTELVEIVRVIKENEDFDPNKPIAGENRQWVSCTYELGSTGATYMAGMMSPFATAPDPMDKNKYLRVSYSKYKPFVVPRSDSNFEYGETGSTTMAIGLIKSLNKKAISKDQAIEMMLRPSLQGPASLKKSYVTNAPNSFVPLDALSAQQKGLRTIYELNNPAIGALTGDVEDMRRTVGQVYFSDFLLFLSRNPKTRTATEAHAVVQEQHTILGPILQSLNWTFNTPIANFIMTWTLDNDPDLPPAPEGLQDRFIKPEFISVFAQAQRAADLPQVERFWAFVRDVGQINPQIFDKVDVDRMADIFEDRLYIPSGVNRDQKEVDDMRQQAAMEQQRRAELEELEKMAGAAKDMGIQQTNGEVR
jgi:hypothetical protein